jgi:hypothetical protein
LYETVLKYAYVCQQANVTRQQVPDFAENRTFSYNPDTRQKSSFAKQGKVLNLGHSDFEIVSDLDIRISDLCFRE